MRIAASLLALTLIAACSPKEEAPADSVAAAPAALTVADFAGTWTNQVMLEGTPDPIPSTTMIDASGTGRMSLQGRDSIPITASVVGDSLIIMSAEYESILRKGVMVTVRTASVRSNDTMTGNVEANYKTATGTQMVKGTITGTKAP
jgi:hypothetical protein